MDIANLFINATIGAIALFILWQFQQGFFKDSSRRDEMLRFERETNQQNHKEFMLMMTALLGKQTKTDETIFTGNVGTGVQIQSAKADIENRITNAQQTLGDALVIIRATQVEQGEGIERIEQKQKREDK